jgi:glycolate oxidase
VKLPYLEHQLGAEHVALLRRIKAAFDPHGILNPGKLGS